MDIRKIIIMFMLYSVIGWISEMIYCYIYDRSFTNRGFLCGPLCPIYACGALFIVFTLSNFKYNPVIIFFLGMIGCSIIEYLTSFLMEKLFNAKWWDYSNYKYNIKGRICLLNSIIFGIGSVIIIYLIQPMVELFLHKLNNIQLTVLSISFVFYFIIDYVLSFYMSFKYRLIKSKKDYEEDDILIINYFQNKKIY